MSSLHPCDEVDIRKGSSEITLQYKQMASARLQSKVDEWLAQGNQIEHVQSNSGKFASFNNGQVLSQNPDKTQLYKFEINPEGKPRPKQEASRRTQRLAAEAVRVKSEKRKAEILQIMRAHGRPIMASTIAGKVGMTPKGVQMQIHQLIERNQVEVVGKLVNSNLYEVVK